MTRRQFYLTERNIEQLERYAEQLGLTASEALRRLLDEFFKDADDLA